MLTANWIKSQRKNPNDTREIYNFQKVFDLKGKVKSAELKATARGVYFAKINGKRVGNYLLTPGWTVYEKRIQVQRYDVTDMLKQSNTLQITLGPGWYSGMIAYAYYERDRKVNPSDFENAIIAQLDITYENRETEKITTDETWQIGDGNLVFADIYDGEIYDATLIPQFFGTAITAENNDKSMLIEQEGEFLTEQERLKPVKIFKTPKEETVLDFGQNLAGYPEISLVAKAGEVVDFSFGEILDKEGNFYNDNYRYGKNTKFHYTCLEGFQTHKPEFTYYGFRYIRINSFPDVEITPDTVTAVAVHSNIQRTGKIVTSDKMLNQLFSNIIWGQKSNFFDVPTDCPQRSERLGWTGDAQVFVKTASYNFNVLKFFKKWLRDMAVSQTEEGKIPLVIPNVYFHNPSGMSAGWGDSVAICPWQMYLTYGDTEVLKDMFEPMCRWVDYITNTTKDEFLWTGASHYGDWLELTAEYGKCKGETRDDIVATAYYAYSTKIVSKVGKLLGKDVTKYEKLYKNIVKKFNALYKDNLKTQTEYILALYFDLVEDKKSIAKALAEKIINDGTKIQTGFIGTPYILHALSQNGYSEIAYDLLLRKEYPGWLYPITKGATTMWEHWDGIKPNGELWPVSMNSYNHYAYGSVADWMYEVSAGINPVEDAPGFEKVLFSPIATDKIDSFYGEIDTKYGKIHSGWYHKDGKVVYEITTPVPATAIIEGKTHTLAPGNYKF